MRREKMRKSALQIFFGFLTLVLGISFVWLSDQLTSIQLDPDVVRDTRYFLPGYMQPRFIPTSRGCGMGYRQDYVTNDGQGLAEGSRGIRSSQITPDWPRRAAEMIEREMPKRELRKKELQKTTGDAGMIVETGDWTPELTELLEKESRQREFRRLVDEAERIVEHVDKYPDGHGNFGERFVLINRPDTVDAAPVSILWSEGDGHYSYIDAPTLDLAYEFEKYLISVDYRPYL
jgi:hypothetical protein